MNTETRSTESTPGVELSGWGLVLMCVIGGLCGGSVAMVVAKNAKWTAPVTAPATASSDVLLRAIPDPSRGVTCWVTSLGGVSCVPDAWFVPEEPKPVPQSLQERVL